MPGAVNGTVAPDRFRRVLVWAPALTLAGICLQPLIAWLAGGGRLAPAAASRPYAMRPAALLAFIPFAFLLWALRREQRTRVPAIVGLALVLYSVLAVVPPRGSQDVYSYLFYGRMLSHGDLNPMTSPPGAMEGDPWLDYVRWQDAPSVYGPVWTYTSAAIAGAAGGRLWPALIAIKALASAGAIAGSFAVARLAGPRRSRWVLAAALLNPLTVLSIAGEGHVDGVLFGLVAGALGARERGRHAVTTLLLVGAALVKPYCGIFLVLHLIGLIRERGVRRATAHGLGAAALIVIAYAPLWAGLDTFAGLSDVASRFSATLPREVARLVGGATGAEFARLLGLSVFLGLFLASLRLMRRGAAASWSLAFAGYLLTTPWFLPWHAIPLLGLVLATGAGAVETALVAGALALSVTALIAVPVVRFGVPLATGIVAARLARGSLGSHQPPAAMSDSSTR